MLKFERTSSAILKQKLDNSSWKGTVYEVKESSCSDAVCVREYQQEAENSRGVLFPESAGTIAVSVHGREELQSCSQYSCGELHNDPIRLGAVSEGGATCRRPVRFSG